MLPSCLVASVAWPLTTEVPKRTLLFHEASHSDTYTLSLHDALPIFHSKATCAASPCEVLTPCRGLRPHHVLRDRIGTWDILLSGRRCRVCAKYGGPHREGEEP